MSVDEGGMLEALREVRDPWLWKSLGQLGMVREVSARRGKVTVSVGLPTEDYPMRAELEGELRGAMEALGIQAEVLLDLSPMRDDELRAVRAALTSDTDRAGQASSGSLGQQGPNPATERSSPLMAKSSRTRILGISSGKGGVGKSTVTVNLAVALARRGYDVGLLDADVYGFSVPKMLGVSSEPIVLEGMLVPPVAHRVRCMSMGFLVDDDQPVIWRGPMLHKALEQFVVDVYWGEPDYLLVDMPPGTGDVALSMAQYLPRTELYVVTTPQAAARRVAQRSAYMAKTLKTPLRGVIENLSWFTGDDGTRYELFGSGGGEQLAGELGVPLLGKVPLVIDVRKGGDEGTPVVVSDPQGQAAKAFDDLAGAVVSLGPSRVYRSELLIR